MLLEKLVIPLEIDNLFTAGLALVTEGVAGLVNEFTEMTKGAMDAENIQADLNATLKSTNGVAGMTADSINDLAKQLQKTTKYEDDTIVSGENMLLTFTNIGKKVFPQATEAMLDMSTKMDKDLNSSAIMLGKALNDPINGISALTRNGVVFTDQQKEMIKTLQEAGDIEGAQAIILAELSKEFGGIAVAAGSTAEGGIARFMNTLDGFKDQIGTAILPTIAKFTDKMATLIDSPKVQGMIDQVVSWLDNLGDTVIKWVDSPEFTGFLDTIVKGLENTTKFITDNLPNWITNFENFLTTLGKVSKWFSETFPQSKEETAAAMTGLKAVYDTSLGVMFDELEASFKNAEDYMKNVEYILGLIGIKFDSTTFFGNLLKDLLYGLAFPFIQLYNQIGAINTVLHTLNGIWDALNKKLSEYLGWLYLIRDLWNSMIPPAWTTDASVTNPSNPTSFYNSTIIPMNSGQTSENKSWLPSDTPTVSFDYDRLAKILAYEVAKVTS